MIALLAAPALAGVFEVAQQSAAAGGTGHASTGRAVDAAAAWFCAAALADDGGLRLAVGAALASSRITATSTDPERPFTTASENGLGTPPHAYASFARGPAAIGVAVNTAFAGGVRWPDDGPLRFESIASAPTFFRVAPFAGVRLGAVRLAAGFHADAGSLSVEKATDHVTDEGRAHILLRGAGVGADASLFVQAGDLVGIGLSYKGRTRLPLEGEADFDVPDPFAPGLPDGAASARWRLPDRLALGVAVGDGRLRGLADAAVTVWSVNDALRIDFADTAAGDVVQVNAWRPSLALRGGGEGDLGPVTLRAGAYVDGLPGPPGPTDTLGPSSPDGARVGGTLGAGVGLGEHVRIDVFGELLRVLERASTSADAPAVAYRGSAAVGGLTAALAL